MDEAELLRLAEKELVGEAKRAAARYSIAGPSGWQPCPLGKTNKTFLINTLRQTVSSNRLKDKSKDERPAPERKDRKLFQGRNSHGFAKANIVFTSPAKRKSEDPKVGSKDSTKTKEVRKRSEGKDVNKNIKRRKHSPERTIRVCDFEDED